MSSLISQSLDFALLTSVRWPVAWAAIAGLAAVAGFAWRRHAQPNGERRATHTSWWLLLLLVCPITMLILATVYWEQALLGSSAYAIVYLLYGLLALEVLIAYTLAWLPLKRRVLVFASCMLSLIWSFGTFMVSGFAVTGTWP